MIIRILGEGQFDVPDALVDELNVLDADVESAIAGEDEGAFGSALAALLERVRADGAALPDEELRPSDAVLPPSDALLEEARDLLRDDGLIPG